LILVPAWIEAEAAEMVVAELAGRAAVKAVRAAAAAATAASAAGMMYRREADRPKGSLTRDRRPSKVTARRPA
jgi:hypothetical protein